MNYEVNVIVKVIKKDDSKKTQDVVEFCSTPFVKTFNNWTQADSFANRFIKVIRDIQTLLL